MAVHESDREDLMKEATALRQRTELSLPEMDETVMAGFRQEGRFSIFFGADPAYHFDDEGRLRRGYFNGCLYRTQGQTLARLTRVRGEKQSHLSRHDLTEVELLQFLGEMDERLSMLVKHIQAGNAKTVRQIPAEPSLLPMISKAVAGILISTERLAPAIKA